ncbi:hypothetical protein [Dysgonomonas mossii]|uniref:Uncharacterized protein n=1 Tax=Dysgonomonas mossii DSM 22836 TaxID=742767 RepID=F8X567_9BACT|nr:hypothetical protein [Dysgonomonas mossii]EGK04673.1 hypothetical protein HMPREF9456_03376 [Dysgonomonas mossii DSM 22836]
MIIDRHTTLEEFIFYMDLFNLDESKIDELFGLLNNYKFSEMFRVSFDELKFKQLIELQTKIKSFHDLIFVSFEVLHGLKYNDIISLSAFDCLGFALYAKNEISRITNLFKDIEYKPTAEEERAGIKKLSHGFFGTIDWYARRMGISNHDEVVELNWMRIYQCLKIDSDNNIFEKRYRQIITQQQKLTR